MPVPLRPSRLPAVASLAALLVACAPSSVAPGVEVETPPPGLWEHPPAVAAVEPPRVLFFGSSTTGGSGASRRDRRWTTLVSRRFGWSEVNRGLSSSTLTELGRKVPSGEARWREAVGGEPADLVVVMYGANDVLARVPLGDPATPGTFRHAAGSVLRGIRAALPGATLLVLTPQPNRATAAAREPYDLALAEAAAAVEATFVHAGAAFPEERLGALGADRLHLNDAGHAALAAFLLEREALFTGRPGPRLAGRSPARAPW